MSGLKPSCVGLLSGLMKAHDAFLRHFDMVMKKSFTSGNRSCGGIFLASYS